jgi:hypothetical protein
MHAVRGRGRSSACTPPREREAGRGRRRTRGNGKAGRRERRCWGRGNKGDRVLAAGTPLLILLGVQDRGLDGLVQCRGLQSRQLCQLQTTDTLQETSPTATEIHGAILTAKGQARQETPNHYRSNG